LAIKQTTPSGVTTPVDEMAIAGDGDLEYEAQGIISPSSRS
jgi:hypothetical protein